MVTSASASLRRIAVHGAGFKFDLVLPAGDALDHALAVAGVSLGPGDRVFGPGGVQIAPGTAAADLREGGLYAIASSRAATVLGGRDSQTDVGGRVLPWGLVAVALAAFGTALANEDPGLRWGAAAIIAVAASVSSLAVARRRSTTDASAMFPAMALAAIAGVLGAPRGTEGVDGAIWDAMFACALGCGGIALVSVLLSAAARVRAVRAGAATAALISTVLGLLAAACPLVGWGAKEFFIVVGAASVLMIRALPALLVNVDEGYSIDYGRFMSLRWTVRGRVPRFVELVDRDEVRDMVTVAEFRLRTAILMFSVLAVPGIVLAVVPLTAGNLLERIAAGVFVCLAVTALLLVSRRTAATMLKRPQRLAALCGAVGAVALFALSTGASERLLLPGAGVLLCIAVAVGAGSVALLRGARSLGWSRVGDIVEAIAVAVVLPAGLLAAGAIDVLRGVLS